MDMHLQAASIGEAVPREDFNAVVQSAFDSAVNLRLAHEDRLITVLVSDHYELPQGIRIETKDPALPSLTVGRSAASRGGILRFDSSHLTVDLRGAAVWKCRVPEINADMRSPHVIQAWSAAWKLLNQQQSFRNTEVIADDLLQLKKGTLLSQRLGEPVLQLISSAHKFDLSGSARATEKMIGLGPGVTPAGDDILIGFFAGLWSTAGADPTRLAFIRYFGDALQRMAKQTNDLSRTYLHHAARGQFSSSLSHLAEVVAAGDRVKQAAHGAMRVGHSSGMDSVTGLLIGLAIWNFPSPLTPLAPGAKFGVRT